MRIRRISTGCTRAAVGGYNWYSDGLAHCWLVTRAQLQPGGRGLVLAAGSGTRGKRSAAYQIAKFSGRRASLRGGERRKRSQGEEVGAERGDSSPAYHADCERGTGLTNNRGGDVGGEHGVVGEVGEQRGRAWDGRCGWLTCGATGRLRRENLICDFCFTRPSFRSWGRTWERRSELTHGAKAGWRRPLDNRRGPGG